MLELKAGLNVDTFATLRRFPTVWQGNCLRQTAMLCCTEANYKVKMSYWSKVNPCLAVSTQRKALQNLHDNPECCTKGEQRYLPCSPNECRTTCIASFFFEFPLWQHHYQQSIPETPEGFRRIVKREGNPLQRTQNISNEELLAFVAEGQVQRVRLTAMNVYCLWYTLLDYAPCTVLWRLSRLWM